MFYFKIIPLFFLIGLSSFIANLLKLDPWLILIIALILSFVSSLIAFHLSSQLSKVARRAYEIAFKNSSFPKEDEIKILNSSLEYIKNNLNQTYAQIALERDLLSAEKNKLATIISSIKEAIIVVDIHKKVILANPSAEKLLGFNQNEMQSKNIDELLSLENSQGVKIASDIYCPVNLLTSDGTKPYQINENLFLKLKTGNKIKIKLSSSSIAGSITADLGCILIVTNTEGERRFESMQVDFVSMASHELRTPLTSILGYLRVLRDEGKDRLTDELKDFLDKAITSAQQLSNLVNNLLNVSRVERGAISINSTPTDLLKLLQQAIDENKIQAVQKNLSLSLHIPQETIPLVLADPVRITEVINNLIGNAINYTKEGGSITLSIKGEGEEVITSVQDTGRGIPDDAIPHLFNKFFRVENALDKSSSNKGSGLGLYLSKSIIDLHHGKIWVESILGKGSTFYFSLPIAKSLTNSNIPGLKLSSTGTGLTT